MKTLILIGIGGNLPTREFGDPVSTLGAAVAQLNGVAGEIVLRSPWYRSAPVPPSGQPDFINAVISINSRLTPKDLLAILHGVEARFGRVRGERWAARTLDLDLLAYHGLVQAGGGGEPVLPHPRMTGRAFVLKPLADIAPLWCHPLSGRTATELLAALPPGQEAEPLNL